MLCLVITCRRNMYVACENDMVFDHMMTSQVLVCLLFCCCVVINKTEITITLKAVLNIFFLCII